ncbi:methylated-DNA--[protein]-cysteine S-methyltransferase [Flavimarina sp. Hel_I_48]|uniref:methylated-DNA--[protein]-cysteine S-methyltransferase n=1 Tax=Flavimarina sp. Hel_I_48 TaxID=1392488 RepID=UPI0004DF8869|nr:methylated-DNA--[protein]-cysteine S-methyltransferase [Flavimarina sp. Hel_I_48]
MKTAIINSPLGKIELTGDENGLATVFFRDDDHEETKTDQIPPELAPAVTQLNLYFEGKITSFDLKLNPNGTDFQKKVWLQLEKIPFGKTQSYMDMARALGDTKVILAAASANGKNPIGIIIPCHRVIGSDNTLTGYAGGLWRKKWLLEHESPVRQTSLF